MKFLFINIFLIITISTIAQSIKNNKISTLKNENKTIDTSWNKLLVGDKMLANGELFNPAGESLKFDFNTRVLNIDLIQKNKFLIAKKNKGISIINAETFKVSNDFIYEKNESGSMFGLTIDADDSTIYFTGSKRNLYVGHINNKGLFKLTQKINLSIDNKTTTPLGIGICSKNLALVALAIPNEVAFVDLSSGKILSKIQVGICPYAVIISKDKKIAFVSNFGGPKPKETDKKEKSAGSDVAVDERSVALRGSVSVIDLQSKKVIKEINTRIHPESMSLSPDSTLLYISDESGDGISVIDVKSFKVIHTISTKPDPSLPYGSLTTDIAFSKDGKILFSANAGNNSIAFIDPKQPQKGPYGFISCGGFPGSICTDGNNLFIGNVTPLKNASLQKVIIPKNKSELDAYSIEAKKGFHFIEMMRTQATKNTKAIPLPIPTNVGEPSSIKHVVYIIRENKKFDQELGDIGMGNCDPKLTEFGDSITPNAHSLAKQFLLLDNYYCNGVNSSDGHQWAIQGITTPYHEKDFSTGRCAYDFGTDPLSYAGCGFIWDHLLRKGISFRNFGETDLANVTQGKTWTNLYDGWKNKTDSIFYQCSFQLGNLKKYSDLRYPGWNLTIPDQIRADLFVNALNEYEQKGNLPEFIIIYLPNDHTNGHDVNVPTPRAYVADNDLATGKIIEALTKSSFWKDMAVFVNEDDPQSGIDHVDAHRSVCYIASPFAKRKTLLSKFYNQSSVLHTICQIFGVQPMNQLVAMAPLMTDCFTSIPNYTGFSTIIPSIALNEMNLPIQKLNKTAATLASLTQNIDFSKPDIFDNDALLFSKYVWSSVNGEKPFPIKYFGVQPKNLKKLGLKLNSKFIN